jgi:hypothetical protein
VAQMRRWLPLAVATLATVLLAGGFGFAVNLFATPRPQPIPQLKTVPVASLSRLGITLAAPTQPLYCGVTGAVAGQGWLPTGAAGCAVSQSTAESAARQGGSGRVVESVLAQVTSTRLTAAVHDLLAWVVVTQQTRAANCIQGVGGFKFCAGAATRTGLTWTQIVIVDAHSGGVITQLLLAPIGGGRTRPGYQRPPWSIPTTA